MSDTTAASARATYSLRIVHYALCIAMSAAFAASAATTYNWQNTDGTGVLNTPGNWSPPLAPLVVNDLYSIPLPADGSGGRFRLNNDLSASKFLVKDGTPSGTSAVFDLGGHRLNVTNIGNTGYLDIFTGNPVVFLNGMLQTRFYLRLGIDADRTVPVRLAFTNVVAQSVPYYTRYAPTITATFCDCFLTNFPRGGINSNTHLDFTRSVYSLKTKNVHHGASSGATNVTMRFADGCTFDRYNYAFHFGGNGPTENCHFIFESGSDLRYKLGISGAGNTVAFTNAVLFGQFDSGGTDSVYTFHDAIISNYPASGSLINNLKGTGNLLSLSGPRTQTYMQYLDFSGTGNRLVLGEGVKSTGRACSFRMNGGSGHSIRADPGSELAASLSMSVPDCTAAFTNSFYRGGLFSLSSTGNRLIFHDTIVSNYPASGNVINNLKGTGSLLAFTGPRTQTYMQYLDFDGTGNRLVFGEGVQSTGKTCSIRVSGGSGHTIRADPGSAIAASLSMGASGCTAAFTNATFRSGTFSSSGAGNAISFHNTVVSNVPASGTRINSLSGADALLSFTGPDTQFWTDYLDVGGQRQRLIFDDNMTLTNRSFALRFSQYARDCDVEIGTNSQIKLDYITWAEYSGRNTNITVRLGKGSKIIQTGRGDLSGSRFGGVGYHCILDDAVFEYRATAAGQTVNAGGTIEFLGDDALMRIYGLNGAIGCIQMGRSDFDGLPPLRLVFRPGRTAFHGSPPIYSDSLGYSYIEPTVVFDVDATDYARGKPGGVHEIPLVRKAKSFTWNGGMPDLDALNAIGVFEPANGCLAFNKNGDLVFRFKRNCPTQLLLR